MANEACLLVAKLELFDVRLLAGKNPSPFCPCSAKTVRGIAIY